MVAEEPRAGIFEVDVPADGLTLAATMHLPAGPTGAGVVFIHGSGPNGRDEASPGQLNMVFPRPILLFETLANSLNDAGIASVRYDKRTCGPFNGCADNGYPAPDPSLSVDDFIADAEAAASWLLGQPEVDRVFVVGHSQGGTFVPILLDRLPDLAGGVMLAAPYFTIDNQYRDQAKLSRELGVAAGVAEAQLEAAVVPLEDLAESLRSIKDGTYDSAEAGGLPTAFWETWIRRTKEAAAIVPELDRPLLIVSGSYDWNVPVAETEAWRSATRRPDHRVVVLDCLTHAFNCVSQPDWLQITPGDIGREVDPALIGEVIDFLLRH